MDFRLRKWSTEGVKKHKLFEEQSSEFLLLKSVQPVNFLCFVSFFHEKEMKSPSRLERIRGPGKNSPNRGLGAKLPRKARANFYFILLRLTVTFPKWS